MINLPPQVLQQMMQKLQGGASAPNGVPISFANSGGATPPMGVSGGNGAGMGGGAGVGGTGIQGSSVPGGNTAQLNMNVGATTGSNLSGLTNGGMITGSEAGMMENPQTMNKNPSTSILSDLTSGVGPPLGTNGYGMATQGNVGNPAAGQGAFDPSGLGGGTPPSGGLGPGNASIGSGINDLIFKGANKSEMGRTIPNKRPASNSLNLNSVYPQTGLQPYRGPLG